MLILMALSGTLRDKARGAWLWNGQVLDPGGRADRRGGLVLVLRSAAAAFSAASFTSGSTRIPIAAVRAMLAIRCKCLQVAARVALGLPSLTAVAERVDVAVVVRASKRRAVVHHAIASVAAHAA